MASYDSVDLIKKMLPKIYAHRKHVAFEIFVARTHYNYLVPMMNKYVFNDGTVKDLMSLRGTIPALYRGKTYNIPVCIWLEESYPASAPICYVNPTREMMIVKGKHTNSNGQVQLPYLQEWRQTECDLVSLLQVMAAMFGESPPVCIRPNSGPEQASCSHQFHRQAEGLQESAPHLSLTRDDGLPFPQENETNC